MLRKTRLDLAGLYQRNGPYWYTGGVHLAAVVALAAGVAPCVPGFLGTTKLMEVGSVWLELYHYAWFLSFGVSAVVYFVAARSVRVK